MNRLLDILQQYNIISPVNKEEQPKGNTFINPVIILAKGESLKIVLDARYLNSLIDESKCNWPIEPIQVILTKINGKYFTTADMNSAYNQMPLDEQSRRLNTICYWKPTIRIQPLILWNIHRTSSIFSFYEQNFSTTNTQEKRNHLFRRCFCAITDKRGNVQCFRTISPNTSERNLKAAPDKSHFF